MTVNEYAALWYVVPQMVREYIWEGRIPAEKIDGHWVLPPGLEKPPDLRRAKILPEVAEARLQQQRAWKNARYRRAKAEGKCVNCYKRYAEPGLAHCAACLAEKRRKWRAKHPDGEGARQRERRARLIAEGKCTWCTRPAVPGRRLCKACAAKAMQTAQARRVRDRMNREIEQRIREATRVGKMPRGSASDTNG